MGEPAGRAVAGGGSGDSGSGCGDSGGGGAGPGGGVADAFAAAYGRPPEGLWHAPGRVNLIGEHTDYNDGLVLPFALPWGVTAAAARGDDDVLRLRSRQAADAPVDVAVGELAPGRVTGWAAYPAGVVWALRAAGHPAGGVSLLIDGDLPAGAGLSSSAALECAVALALRDLFELDVARPELAGIAQRAENEFVGMPCGIMDQSASLLCVEDHALLLDCRSLLTTQVPLDLGGLAPLIIDTGVRHELVAGEYAARRAACERAARLLGVDALRDIDDLTGALDTLSAGGDHEARRRARHVVTEIHRVNAAVGLLRAGAAGQVGALLNHSHLSLRDDFEVSWPAADLAVGEAVRAGARGARMMGGGFGGSVLALVPRDGLERVKTAVTDAYEARGLAFPGFLEARPARGAARLA
jgi:galactokinase